MIVIDDQFVNQQGIRLNFMDLGLADRVVILSNGGEALSFFESFFESGNSINEPQETWVWMFDLEIWRFDPEFFSEFSYHF